MQLNYSYECFVINYLFLNIHKSLWGLLHWIASTPTVCMTLSVVHIMSTRGLCHSIQWCGYFKHTAHCFQSNISQCFFRLPKADRTKQKKGSGRCLTFAVGCVHRRAADDVRSRDVDTPHHAGLLGVHLLFLLFLFLPAVPHTVFWWILICTLETCLIEGDIELQSTQTWT